MEFLQLDIEGLAFIDPATGLRLAEYVTTTPRALLDGKPATMGLIEKNVLDRKATRGF